MDGKSWQVDIENLDHSDSLDDSVSSGLSNVNSVSQLTYEKEFQDNKDALLFVIDVNEYMITPTKEGFIPLQTILENAYESIVDRLVSSPVNAAGVFLYGVKNKHESFENCKVLLNLGTPTVDAVKELHDAIEGTKLEFNQVYNLTSSRFVRS